MKNKIALASAFVAASSLATAEIVINDFLSFEGFVDMSYQYGDIDSDGQYVADGSDNSFQVDQVEINWLFDFDPVTAQIDIAYLGSDADGISGTTANTDDDLAVEQAFATYSLDDGLAITAGRFASMLGFEAFEPTGLYQFSFAYDYSILPGYAEGVKVTYETEDMFFGGSLLGSYSDDENKAGRLGGSGDSNWAVEVAASFLFGDNDEFNWFIGGFYEDADAAEFDGSTYTINTYLTYEVGAWIFAGEFNYGNSETGAFGLSAQDGTAFEGFDIYSDDDDAMSGLLMANYAYSDQGSVTFRLSYEERTQDGATAFFGGSPIVADAGDFESEQYKLTVAHGWAFTDNLFLVTEVSYIDGEVDSDDFEDDDFDGLLGAVELIFSF